MVLDWIIICFALLLALWGYSQGILVGAFSLGGFLGGAYLGARLAPVLLSEGSRSPYAPLVALLGACIIGGLCAYIFEGVGRALKRVLAQGPFAFLDALGGALLTGALGLIIWWLIGAAVLNTPQLVNMREAVQQSAVLAKLNNVMPPSGPILKALARFDPFPTISGPSAQGLTPPSARILRAPGVEAAASAVVRITGTACGLGIEGSGWVAKPGLVVTNAHVVAGQKNTAIWPRGGGSYDAYAVHYDTKNDLALLRAPGMSSGRLGVDGSVEANTEGAVLGFPENGPYTLTAATVGSTVTVVSEDSYGRGPVKREITVFRSEVRHGNSGGPVVDAEGHVMTTVFAASSDAQTAYGVPNSITSKALATAGTSEVSTGPCT